MEEDDDDLYAPNGASAAPAQDADAAGGDNDEAVKMDEDAESGEEGEEEESDDDIEIILDRPGELVHEQQSQPKHESFKSEPSRATSSFGEPSQRQQAAPTQSSSTPSAPTGPSKSSAQPAQKLKSGAGYPEVRTSSMDVNATPSYPLPNGSSKPITEIDVDADLAEREKPWRRPGADQSDYFNYGFDEFTWTTYCLRQQQMAQTLTNQKAESAAFQAQFADGGMPGMSGMPSMPGVPTGPAAGSSTPMQNQSSNQGQQPGMGGMAGMPGMDDQVMAQMMQQMMQQGIDPANMDYSTFVQQYNQMQGGGGAGMQPQPPQGPAAQQGYGGYGGGNSFRGGRGGSRRW